MQMKTFLAEAGVDKTDNFEQYFAQAADIDNFPGGGKCCIMTYRKVKRHYQMQSIMG
jgi:hypothetical protein